MQNRPHPVALQQCALPGCDTTIEQPEIGGLPRLYCTYEHRGAARRMRSIARVEADPLVDQRARPPERSSALASTWLTDPFSLPQNR